MPRYIISPRSFFDESDLRNNRKKSPRQHRLFSALRSIRNLVNGSSACCFEASVATKRPRQERSMKRHIKERYVSSNFQTWLRGGYILLHTLLVCFWDACARKAMRISIFNTAKYTIKNHVGRASTSKTSESAKQSKAKKQEGSMKPRRRVQSEEGQAHQASQGFEDYRRSTQKSIANRSPS